MRRKSKMGANRFTSKIQRILKNSPETSIVFGENAPIDEISKQISEKIMDENKLHAKNISVTNKDTNKKYEFTGEVIKTEYAKFHRIVALKDFDDVKKGDIGGWIESESNLSQDGNAWVYDNAKVSGDANVCENAKVSDNAEIYCGALVYGNATVEGNAIICGYAEVYENSHVREYAVISGKAKVYGNAWVFGHAEVYGNALIFSRAEVYGNALIFSRAEVYGNAWIFDHAKVCGNACIFDNAKVFGGSSVYDQAKIYNIAKVCDSDVCGFAEIKGSAYISEYGYIKDTSDYVTISGFDNRCSTMTFYRCVDGTVKVKWRDFCGTIAEFRYKKTLKDCAENSKELLTIADLVEKHFKQEKKDEQKV